MVGRLLARGMLAGALAGAAAALFAWLFGEPALDIAIAFEQLDHSADTELFSRSVQSTIGLLTGLLVYGGALGGIFALVFAYAHGRLGRLSPRAVAGLLALLGFLALVLVPQVKYPANPPGIGESDTIGARTALYFALLGFSLIAAIAATSTARQLARRFGAWNAVLLAGAAYLAAITASMLALPAAVAVPADFPAAALWHFRLATIGTQAVLWTALGLGFGALAERLLAPQRLRSFPA